MHWTVVLDTKNSQYDQYWKVFPEDVAFDMAVSYDFDANKGNNISSCITTFPDYFSLKTTGYLSCSEVQSIHEALYDDDDKFVSTVVLTILKYLAILMVLFTIFFVSCIYYKFFYEFPYHAIDAFYHHEMKQGIPTVITLVRVSPSAYELEDDFIVTA